jgi:hypothetical protein
VHLIVRGVDNPLTEIIEIDIGILKIGHGVAYIKNPAIDIISRMTHYVVKNGKKIPPRTFGGKPYNPVEHNQRSALGLIPLLRDER